jgi:hypothetical protein
VLNETGKTLILGRLIRQVMMNQHAPGTPVEMRLWRTFITGDYGTPSAQQLEAWLVAVLLRGGLDLLHLARAMQVKRATV